MIADPPGGTVAEPGRAGRPLAPGAKVGKYRLDRVIGEGGMGIVWAAFDPDLERAVAIKLLRAGEGEATLRSRLLREARAMARLKHPNVLTVYEVGTDQNRDYIAMELVDGESLEHWLARRPPRDQVMAALLAAGRGLAAAHDAGLVHRDFKPHNVLRSRDGHVYVTDFGLARGHIEEGVEVTQIAVAALPDRLSSQLGRPLDSLLDSPLTQTGVLIGTPAYMAPEQFAGRVPDARSDQFAFCVTAWEALAGVRPFGGASLAELERAAASGVRAGEAELPRPVRAVLARGLDPSPAARYPDLPALLAALAAAAPPPERRPGRRWLAVASLGAVVTAAGIGLYALSGAPGADDDEDCRPGEQVFAAAWSPDRRSAVMRAHPGGGAIGAVVLLDGIGETWTAAWDRACASPPGDQRRERIDCLLEVRDQVDDIVVDLARPGEAVEMGELGLLSVTVARCDPDAARELIPDFERLPSGSWPVPPVPPVPAPAPR